MKPNLVILHTDQQRKDSLGCYGNATARTPNLDALAARGMRFDSHYANNPVCMPSRASFFTGRQVQSHGVVNNGYPLSPEETTIADVLAGEGYSTAAFGKMHLTPWLAPAESGFEESQALWHTGKMDHWTGPYFGFQDVQLCLSHGDVAFQHGGTYTNWVREQVGDGWDKLCENVQEGPREDPYHSKLPLELHHSTWIADQAVDYIGKHRDKPFLLYAGFPDPHHPFTPPEPYSCMFEGCSFPQPARKDGEHDARPVHYREAYAGKPGADGGACRPLDLREGEMQEIIAATYGMVSLIDDSVGRIMQALGQNGLRDNTVVVFTSDHGDFLGDHDFLLKGAMPCRSLLNIPFIVAGPGCAVGATDVVMSNVDAVPTLLDLLDAPVPGCVQGRSFKDVVSGTGRPKKLSSLTTHWSGEARLLNFTLYTDAHRITHYPRLDDGELYNLENDPGELTNLFHSPAHRALRDDYLKRLQEELARYPMPDPGPAPAPF